MAPRIPDIVEMAKDFINPDRADNDQEEYLDRLGVEEESEVVEEPVSAIDREREAEIQARRIQARHQDDSNYYNAMLGHDRTYSAVHEHYTNDTMHYEAVEFRQETMRWSNGDTEIRQRRRPPRRPIDPRLRMYRDASKDFVHHEVQKTKDMIIELVINEVRVLIFDYMNERERGIASHEEFVAVQSMVDHYLEDLGDDIISRYHVDMRQNETSFSPTLWIMFELPNGRQGTCNIPLSRY